MQSSQNLSQLISSFFGLTFNNAPLVRKNLFKQIHEIVFHGKGGYDWNTVYNMPIWLRKFTFYEINKFYKDEADSIKKSQDKSSGKKTVIDPQGQIKTPSFIKPTKSNWR